MALASPQPASKPGGGNPVKGAVFDKVYRVCTEIVPALDGRRADVTRQAGRL
jgi:hypothetical protein